MTAFSSRSANASGAFSSRQVSTRYPAPRERSTDRAADSAARRVGEPRLVGAGARRHPGQKPRRRLGDLDLGRLVERAPDPHLAHRDATQPPESVRSATGACATRSAGSRRPRRGGAAPAIAPVIRASPAAGRPVGGAAIADRHRSPGDALGVGRPGAALDRRRDAKNAGKRRRARRARGRVGEARTRVRAKRAGARCDPSSAGGCGPGTRRGARARRPGPRRRRRGRRPRSSRSSATWARRRDAAR